MALKVENLSSLVGSDGHEAELIIIGSGPAGLSIAKEFSGTSTRVILLESGEVNEFQKYGHLNLVEGVFNERYNSRDPFRLRFHGGGNPFWDPDVEPYGMRLRGFGGSSAYWGGKVSTFDEIDFVQRNWIPHSGWPISRDSLSSYFERASAILNLGPHVYDEEIWPLLGRSKPTPELSQGSVRSTFWQFARSQVNKLDMVRFARDIGDLGANIRVITNATATELLLEPDLARIFGVKASALEGGAVTFKTKKVVLAGGAIENARLLLSSNQQIPNGIGNQHDNVGRFLLDHPGNVIGYFPEEAINGIIHRFGFFGMRKDLKTYMYSHGVSLSPEVQQAEQLLNVSISFTENISPDDPFKAAMRIARGKSTQPLKDLTTTVRGAGLLAQGLGMKLFQSNLFPEFLKDPFVNVAMKFFPNFVVRQYRSLGAPHKLVQLDMVALCEQEPSPDNRVVLSDVKDQFGVPRARCIWSVGELEGRSIARLAQLFSQELKAAGLPEPVLDDWIVQNRPGDFQASDMAHSSGTTRMSADPKDGVVDANLQVHTCEGLYIAGNSVFPTIGHANPTLMNVALAIRLADHLKSSV